MTERLPTDESARLAALVESLALEPSAPSPCPYLPGRDSRLAALRPKRLSPGLYAAFLDLNFRRLGTIVYPPACEGCRECRQLPAGASRTAVPPVRRLYCPMTLHPGAGTRYAWFSDL